MPGAGEEGKAEAGSGVVRRELGMEDTGQPERSQDEGLKGPSRVCVLSVKPVRCDGGDGAVPW